MIVEKQKRSFTKEKEKREMRHSVPTDEENDKERFRILERDMLCAAIHRKEKKLKALYDEQEELEESIIRDKKRMKEVINEKKQ